jgi:selenocysteine lyase/cysteine desulfurase
MNVAVRGGLHCAPYAHETAGTLDTGTVRFSFSPFNTPGEVKKACADMEIILRDEK